MKFSKLHKLDYTIDSYPLELYVLSDPGCPKAHLATGCRQARPAFSALCQVALAPTLLSHIS